MRTWGAESLVGGGDGELKLLGTNREQRLFRNKTGFRETGEKGSGSPPLAVFIARIFGLLVGRVISTSENLMGSGNKHQPQKLRMGVPLFWATCNSGGQWNYLQKPCVALGDHQSPFYSALF